MRKRRKGATVESWGWKAFLAVVIFVVLYKRVLSFTNSVEVEDNFIFLNFESVSRAACCFYVRGSGESDGNSDILHTSAQFFIPVSM